MWYLFGLFLLSKYRRPVLGLLGGAANGIFVRTRSVSSIILVEHFEMKAVLFEQKPLDCGSNVHRPTLTALGYSSGHPEPTLDVFLRSQSCRGGHDSDNDICTKLREFSWNIDIGETSITRSIQRTRKIQSPRSPPTSTFSLSPPSPSQRYSRIHRQHEHVPASHIEDAATAPNCCYDASEVCDLPGQEAIYSPYRFRSLPFLRGGVKEGRR